MLNLLFLVFRMADDNTRYTNIVKGYKWAQEERLTKANELNIAKAELKTAHQAMVTAQTQLRNAEGRVRMAQGKIKGAQEKLDGATACVQSTIEQLKEVGGWDEKRYEPREKRARIDGMP